MRIAIRTDSSTAIGTGHLRRMLSLAEALRAQGAEVRFVCRALDGHAAALVEPKGFALSLLPARRGAGTGGASGPPYAAWAGVPQALDVDETVAVLRDFVPSCVVVDHYAFDAAWHHGIRAGLGSVIAAIDDLADRALAADLVVDQNYHPDHRAKFAKVLPASSQLLAGPHYAMLAPVYADAPRYRFRDEVRSIGLFLGGADAGNDSARALAAIAASGFAGAVEIVSTSANPNLAALRRAVAGHANAGLTLDLPDLAGFFARHDLQIGAGGSANWERCCIGVPTLCLICADNHRHSVPALESIGALVAHDLLADPDGATLTQALRSLLAAPAQRRTLAANALALVDGRGAARVAAALVEA